MQYGISHGCRWRGLCTEVGALVASLCLCCLRVKMIVSFNVLKMIVMVLDVINMCLIKNRSLRPWNSTTTLYFCYFLFLFPTVVPNARGVPIQYVDVTGCLRWVCDPTVRMYVSYTMIHACGAVTHKCSCRSYMSHQAIQDARKTKNSLLSFSVWQRVYPLNFVLSLHWLVWSLHVCIIPIEYFRGNMAAAKMLQTSPLTSMGIMIAFSWGCQVHR